jgi:hypothetical protein
VLEALQDGGRGGGHDGQDLRALRIELCEGAGQHLQGGGRVLHRARAPALRAVDGISERARRNDGLFGQRLHRARLMVGRQSHVPLAGDDRAHVRAEIMMTVFTDGLHHRPPVPAMKFLRPEPVLVRGQLPPLPPLADPLLPRRALLRLRHSECMTVVTGAVWCGRCTAPADHGAHRRCAAPSAAAPVRTERTAPSAPHRPTGTACGHGE